jgi:Flp pilus assembly pilin Flp
MGVRGQTGSNAGLPHGPVGLREDRPVLRGTVIFGRDERGNDLVEYSLLLAAICLAGAAMFIGIGGTTSSLWGIVNSRLAASNQGS